VRDRRDEVGPHLVDDTLGGDVPEGENAARDRLGRIAHQGFGEREPDLLVSAHDRHEAIRAPCLRLEVALQNLERCPAERFRRRHPRDAGGGCVPDDDAALAVDGDDPVGDIRQDRDALLVLQRQPLVELGVRERNRRAHRERPERLDLLVAPNPRLSSVHREHTMQRPFGSRERHAQIGTEPLRDDRISVGPKRVGRDVLACDGGTELHDIAAEPAGRRRSRANGVLDAVPRRRADHELAFLEHRDRARVGAQERRRLPDDLVEHRERVELRRKRAARPRKLL
jgi:hypothetical protein